MATINTIDNAAYALTVSTGNVSVSSGNISTSTGGITAATTLSTTGSGNVTATSGNVVLTSGNLTLPTTSATVGSITQSGGTLLNTYGTGNLFMGGGGSVQTVGTANYNTCIGFNSCLNITTAANCCAVGVNALGNITGDSNSTGFGYNAAASFSKSSATNNTCFGYNAGWTGSVNLTGTSNTFYGASTGTAYTGAESTNTLIGYGVTGTSGENNVIRIGNGTGTSAGNLAYAYIYGIYNNAISGSEVYIGSNGQLGTISSNRDSKYDINDMGNASSCIYALNPCSFTFKSDPEKHKQYGLIAEDVLPIAPDLVQYDQNGKINGLAYEQLRPMLVNELQNLKQRVTALQTAMGI